MKNTKRALFLSVVSIFLCVAMLAGTTFAWFTDSVESTGNIIKTGELKVAMEYSNTLNGTYADASDTAIFNHKLWEPGYTDEKYIEITNLGDLAFKYNLTIVPTGDVSILADVIDVYFALNPTTDIVKFEDAVSAGYAKVGTLAQLIEDTDGIAYGVLLPASGAANIDQTQAAAANALTGSFKAGILLHMQESADNDYQNKSIGSDFSIVLNATQFTYEKDSFDNKYDEDSFVADYYATNADEMIEYLENAGAGETIGLLDDVKIEPANMSNAYGTTGINIKNGQTLDGNGNILDIKGAGGTWDSGINTTGGTIRNLTVTGSFRGIFVNHNSTHSEPVILENVIIDGTTYTISCDQGLNQNLYVTGCTFNGWTSYAATIGKVEFTDCSFGEGNGYAYCRPYAPTKFVGCEFEAGFRVDARAAVTFENCKIGGVALTADNLATLVTNNAANATVIG